MFTAIPYDSLGHANYGWLDAHYHFSFAQYHNPARMGIGTLRVINDDLIKAGSGFDMHPHRNMEIITFVRKGAISHKDSRGNEGRTEAGDVQVMSAGKGVYHSEFNLESEDTSLYQIWITPKETGIEPRWDSAKFSDKHQIENTLPILVSGRKEDQDHNPLYIHQNASISGGYIESDKSITYKIKDQAYVLISQGDVEINGTPLTKGDAMHIVDEEQFDINALTQAQALVIDAP